MEDLFSLNEGALRKVHELSEQLAAKAWGDHSREGLVSALSQCLEKLSELKVDLEKAEKIIGQEAEPRLRQHIVEMEKEISVLERNACRTTVPA
jgi:hypothetical protein